jgi:ketosteroid isomerase-like protein
MDTSETQFRRLEDEWAEAEQHGDTATLDTLTTEDFTLVGPLGFVLSKNEWLERYRGGALVTEALTFDELHIRYYGQAVIVIGRHTQRAAYHGHRSDGQFRATHVAVRDADQAQQLRLASIALSPLGQPPAGSEAAATDTAARDTP